MSKNKTPNPQGPKDSAATSAAESFVSGEAVPSGNTSQAEKNRWLIPGVAFASAALLAGALGFAVGTNNSPDMRPVAMSGQAFGQNNGQAPGDWQGRGMNGQGPGMNDHKGHGKNRGPGQMNSGDGQKLPHCHDVSGTDVAANADGTCVDGSTPGFMGGKNTSPNQNPAPTTSSSPTVQ